MCLHRLRVNSQPMDVSRGLFQGELLRTKMGTRKETYVFQQETYLDGKRHIAFRLAQKKKKIRMLFGVSQRMDVPTPKPNPIEELGTVLSVDIKTKNSSDLVFVSSCFILFHIFMYSLSKPIRLDSSVLLEVFKSGNFFVKSLKRRNRRTKINLENMNFQNKRSTLDLMEPNQK